MGDIGDVGIGERQDRRREGDDDDRDEQGEAEARDRVQRQASPGARRPRRATAGALPSRSRAVSDLLPICGRKGHDRPIRGSRRLCATSVRRLITT